MEKALKDSKDTDVDTDAAAETTVESKEETESEEHAEVETEDSSSTTTDYDEIIAAEQARKAKAREDFEKRESERKTREKGIVYEKDDEEDKPLTSKQLERILAREREETRKQFEEERAMEIARKYTTSEKEAEAAILYWKNRIVPTGNIEEDVTFAIAGLSHKKVLAKNAELARALKGKQGSQTHATSVHHDSTTGPGPKIDAGTQASYVRAGFTYDSKAKLWIKKLPNGTHVYKDPKTKQVLPYKAK